VQNYTGRYTRALLNQLVGESGYTIRTFSFEKLTDKEGYNEAVKALEDEDLSFAYMSDTKLTCLWVHNYPGWMNYLDLVGIKISPSSKVAKRVTVLTRITYLWAFYLHDDIRIASMEPGEFSTYDVDDDTADKFLDGANVISRELLEVMMTNGSNVIDEQFKNAPIGEWRGNPWDKASINRAVDRAGSFSIRVMTKDGLIKGDAICVPRAQIPGNVDVLYCKKNIKRELRSERFVFVLAEPHPTVKRHEFSKEKPAPPPVWSDDQSMSWLGWLYPHDQLVQNLRDFAEITYNDIEEGRYPRFFTDTSKIDDEFSTLAQFQEQSLEWKDAGFDLWQSIFLQERVGQGAVNQLAKKRRWPISCAIYVHVATDSWLHAAGYFAEDGSHPWPFKEPNTPRGYVWLHEETGRLIYNDLDFAELYPRHGGWDLDDSVKAHYRTIANEKVIVAVRSPNSYGEYDVKKYVEGTYYPEWKHADGSVTAFPELGEERPPYVENLDIRYTHPDLSPEALGVSREKTAKFTPELVRETMDMSIEFRNVFGRSANVAMVYAHTFESWRPVQLAPIESIIDACTQEQSLKALDLIEKDTETVIKDLRGCKLRVDRRLWNKRIQRKYPDVKYADLDWSKLNTVHDNLCALYKRKYFELAQRTVEFVDPDVLDLGKLFEDNGGKLIRLYYRLVYELPRLEGETRVEFSRKVNRAMCAKLEQLDDYVIYGNIFAMARYVYTHRHGNKFKDTPLFQSDEPGRQSVFGYYLDALEFYGVGKDDWNATMSCAVCGVLRLYTDRVALQMHQVQHMCASCHQKAKA